MGPPRVRFTFRTMMVAVAITGIAFAVWNRAREAYDAYRFQKGWGTRDVTGRITAVDRKRGRSRSASARMMDSPPGKRSTFSEKSRKLDTSARLGSSLSDVSGQWAGLLLVTRAVR